MGNERELLDSLGLQGWDVKGRSPDTKRVQKADATGATVVVDEPTGNVVWTISDGKGHYRQMTVAVSGTGGSSANYNFTVVDPPKDLPDSATTKPPTASEQNEAALNKERDQNAANSKWGRVTNAERIALEQKEAAAGRQLSNDERNAALAQAREDRLAANQSADNARALAAQNASNQIASARLALDQAKYAQGDVTTIKGSDGSTNLVRVKPDGTTEVLFSMPAGIQIEKASDGTILAYDPSNPSAPAREIWKPTKPPTLIPGQDPTKQSRLLQTDPNTGQITAVDNPLGSAAQQRFQDYHDGINTIEGMLTRGELTIDEANNYKGMLRQNFDAALQGTTPYQQQQDKLVRQQQRMVSGAGLLNQRVSSGSGLAESLLNSAVNIVGNPHFMDPSAVAGFSPFSGAFDYVTQLGGGPDVYSAAAQAVQSGMAPDPASALLSAALPSSNPIAAAPTSQPAAPPAQPLAPGFGGGPYQGAPNPNVFGSGMGNVLLPDPGAALISAALGQAAPNELRIYGR